MLTDVYMYTVYAHTCISVCVRVIKESHFRQFRKLDVLDVFPTETAI